MTRSDFMVMVTTVFPDAVVTEDARGELVIHTRWQTDPLDSDNVTFMDRPEDVSFALDDDSVNTMSSYWDENPLDNYRPDETRQSNVDYGRGYL